MLMFTFNIKTKINTNQLILRRINTETDKIYRTLFHGIQQKLCKESIRTRIVRITAKVVAEKSSFK